MDISKYLIIYCPRIEIYTTDSKHVESTTSKVRFRKNQIQIEVCDSLIMSPFIDDIKIKNRLCDDLLNSDNIRKRRNEEGCTNDSSVRKSVRLDFLKKRFKSDLF